MEKERKSKRSSSNGPTAHLQQVNYKLLPNQIVTKDSDANARRAVFDKFHASKKNFIKASEFDGEGKTIQALKYENIEAKGDFGPGIQFTCREPETGRERLWTTSSPRAIEAIEPYIEKGVETIHVYKRGTGKETQYFAKEVNDGSSNNTTASSLTATTTSKKGKKKAAASTTGNKKTKKKKIIKV